MSQRADRAEFTERRGALSADDRARAYRNARDYLAYYARNGASRFCRLHPGHWYAMVHHDRTSLLAIARSHEITILVDNVDAATIHADEVP